MATLIHQRIELAQRGQNPTVIARLASGWAVLGDSQFPLGYCLLLCDPVVPTLNDLGSEQRIRFLLDMAAIGDALLENTEACRINYEIQGNSEHALHAHIFARYRSEDAEYARGPVWRYGDDTRSAVPFDAQRHGALQRALARSLDRAGRVLRDPGSEPGHATFQGRHSQLQVRRPAPGVVVLTICGSDIGEHGVAPFLELDNDLAAGSLALFVDARETRGVSTDVSAAWSRWLSAHRSALSSMHILTGSRLVQFTAHFVQSFAALGELMRIHTHAATFDAELEARLRAPPAQSPDLGADVGTIPR